MRSPRAVVLALLAPALAACATSRPAPSAPRVAGVEACSAQLALRLAPDSDAAPGERPAPDSISAFVAGAGVELSPSPVVGLPGTLRATWRDTVFRADDGAALPRRPRTVYVSAVQIGRWSTGRPVQRVEVSQAVPLRCGERAERAIAIPRTRVLRVTSDPAGASVFARVRTGPYTDEERFLGTTPVDVALVWEPEQRRATLRLERSGHAAVTRQVERGEDEVRVILHPLPDRRP